LIASKQFPRRSFWGGRKPQIQVKNTIAAVVGAATAAAIHPLNLLPISGLNCHYYLLYWFL